MKRRPETPTEADRLLSSQDSTNFRTPVSKHKRPNQNGLPVSTFTGIEIPAAAKVNPFEKHILANLHRPFWSPTIFKTNLELLETPPQTTWAIDQISKLYPKDIEDSPSTHQNELKLTPSTEAKAQADIEMFFSQSCVLPSPSGPSVPAINPNNSTNVLMGAMELNTPLPRLIVPLAPQNSHSENSAITATQTPTTSKTMKDSWTSTLLSFPPTLPPHIEALLQPYMKSIDDENLSSSSCAVTVNYPSKAFENNPTRKNSILAPCLSLNTSNSNGSNSRRRRLAFSSTDEDEDENRRFGSQLDFSYEEFSPSPMQIGASSPMTIMSPSRFHSSPSPYFPKDGFHGLRRSEDTPCSSSRNTALLSPNLTPIRRPNAANKSATAKMLDLSQHD